MSKLLPPGVLDEAALKVWTKIKRRGELEAWLNANGVLWWPGGGGEILTTLEAVNRAMLKTNGAEWKFGAAA